jgi:ubiquinone/menaquinone biosynthesis C-methylase UbiE
MAKLWWRLVRFGFRLLYNECAFTYDWVSWLVSLGAWRCWQRASLKHLNVAPGDGLILELAHGTGNLQIDLQTAGYRTIGFDLSPHMGRIAGRKLRGAGLSARLVRGMAQQLPFNDGAFAAVVSTFPTNFIVMPETLREVNRVLAHGGRLVIVPNGVLTTGGVTEKGIEWLYRITGQHGEGGNASLADFFTPYGFDATMVQETCPRSIAQVIIAQKRG